VRVQMRQRVKECIPVLHNERDLLDKPLVALRLGNVHSYWSCTYDKVVMPFVKAEESTSGRAIWPLPDGGHFTADYLGVEFQGPLEVGYQDTYVTNTLDFYSHIYCPPFPELANTIPFLLSIYQKSLLDDSLAIATEIGHPEICLRLPG